jgi:integrase
LRGTREVTERPTKTGQERTISLPNETASVLHRHLRAQRRGRVTPWVFTNVAGKPLHGPFVTRHLRALLEQAGLPTVTMYQLRHTGATLRLGAGVPLATIQAVMGHSTPAQTARYAQVLDPLRRADADAMDALLTATRPAKAT